MEYTVCGISDIGKVRSNNEDSYFVSPGKEGFFLVADGMGGHNAGEVASAMSRDIISERITKLSSGTNVENALREAFLDANRLVREKGASAKEFEGLGCTCATLTLQDNSFYLAHVGDSRIYLYRKDVLQQVTRDHSYVEELFIRGLITEEEKVDHPYRNQIVRYIGNSQKLEVDITSGPVLNGDVFLLCSDGLTDELTPAKMQPIFARGLSSDETARALIDEALKGEARDNTTVVVVKITGKKTSFFKKILGW